jgi:hypothetical protein
MPLSPTEAADTLRDISKTEQRSSTAYGYRTAAPHLILWGVVWAIGYGTTAAKLRWDPLWPLLVLSGSLGSFWIGWRMSRGRPKKAFDWRFGATFAAIVLFISAVFVVMPPRTDAQIGAFFPILVAFYYALIGIWTRGARMLIAGALLAILTLIGFLYLQNQFALWMTVVGGGGLILGGLWLRSA